MDATTIRVREPRELLALLPYQLGFRPQRSAVAVALRPPRGRVGLVARVDLADLGDDGLGPQLARRLVTHLAGDGADRAVLVLYTDRDPRRGTAPAGRVDPVRPADPDELGDVAPAVRHFRAAASPFLGEVPVWVVSSGGYLSLDCTDDDCCPPGGRPLVELQSTAVGAHMVLAGAMVADSREMLVPELAGGAAARRNAARAGSRWQARRATAEASGPAALAQWRWTGLRVWRSEVTAALSGDVRVRPAALGRLGCALADVVVRDAVLMTLIAGAGDVPERSLVPRAAGDDSMARLVADLLGAVLSPRDGVPPDVPRHTACSAVLERLVAHQRTGDRAPALTLLALLAWWRGDGARAGVLLDRAGGADPTYRLAQLLGEALAAGLAPGWVRTRP